MIKELAIAIGVTEQAIYAGLALIFISIVYGFNQKIGLLLGVIVMLGILTTDWNKKSSKVDLSDLVK